jgi:hypothetical protein
LTRRLRLAQLASEPGPPPVASRGERLSSLVLTVAGGVIASLGGIVTLGTTLLVLGGHPDAQPIGQVVAGGVFAGLTPTLIGVALFFWG